LTGVFAKEGAVFFGSTVAVFFAALSAADAAFFSGTVFGDETAMGAGATVVTG
jgi:hypothetical protein